MKKTTIVATAAALFAAGAIVSSAGAQGTNRCIGVNACKGQSECKMANSSCKGQNACKGQGWVNRHRSPSAPPWAAARRPEDRRQPSAGGNMRAPQEIGGARFISTAAVWE